MEQDDTELAAAAAQMAAAAALHRKTPGKAGLPTLLLLRGDISKTTQKKTSKQKQNKHSQKTRNTGTEECYDS